MVHWNVAQRKAHSEKPSPEAKNSNLIIAPHPEGCRQGITPTARMEDPSEGYILTPCKNNISNKSIKINIHINAPCYLHHAPRFPLANSPQTLYNTAVDKSILKHQCTLKILNLKS